MPHPMLEMEAKSTYEYEEFVLVWKLDIFHPKDFRNLELDSPVFVGGEKGRHSWILKWRPVAQPKTCCYLYYIDIILKSFNFSKSETGSTLEAFASVTFKEPSTSQNTIVESVRFSSVKEGGKIGGCFSVPTILYGGIQPGIIVDNILTVRCRIISKAEARHSASQIFPGFNRPLSAGFVSGKNVKGIQTLSSSMKCALKSDEFSDVTILTNSKSFPVHKIILAARSSVFAGMFRANMLEAKKNSVEIKDFDDNVVEGMLEYIYTGCAPDLKDCAVDTLRIADKYELLELKEECEQYLCDSLTVENAADVFYLSTLTNSVTLKAVSMQFIIRNKAKVSETNSFKELIQSHPEMLVEMFLAV